MVWLDIIFKVVGTVSAAVLAVVAIRQYRLASREQGKEPSSTQPTHYSQLWRDFAFVVSVVAIAFFTTLLTQYVYPPYARWAPPGYEPLLSDTAVKILWIVGIGVLLVAFSFPQRALRAWGAANIRERVAQAIILGVCIIIAALILSR